MLADQTRPPPHRCIFSPISCTVLFFSTRCAACSMHFICARWRFCIAGNGSKKKRKHFSFSALFQQKLSDLVAAFADLRFIMGSYGRVRQCFLNGSLCFSNGKKSKPSSYSANRQQQRQIAFTVYSCKHAEAYKFVCRPPHLLLPFLVLLCTTADAIVFCYCILLHSLIYLNWLV